MKNPTTDVAFTASVKAVQERLGSRRGYASLERRGGWPGTVTPALADFLAERDSLYFATANRDGQPYVQHRGGPPGFVKVLDEHTLAFADFSGNRQYITAGNLAENPKAFIFLMDYETRRRVKLWGRARVVEDDAALFERVGTSVAGARIERVIVFELTAWDENCHQHIPRKYEADSVDAMIARFEERLTLLEEENIALRREVEQLKDG